MAREMTHIPIALAAQRLRVSISLLTEMVDSGTLKVVVSTDGQVLLPLVVVDQMEKELELRDQIWRKVKKFEKETVSTMEAQEIVSLGTLYRCISKGYIRAGEGGKGGRGKKRLLNKADVLYVAELSKLGGGRGHRLFGPDTIPPHMLN